jgi:hypothetical protein
VSAGWVAGSVRGRALAQRRLGAGATRALAASPSLEAALAILADTPYGREVHPEQSIAAAQRAVAATLLWHLRVLAGWLPRGGAGMLRLLAGWFEIADLDELLQRLAGKTPEEPFHLGALATAWPRLTTASSMPELRDKLAASPWGDPGESTARAVGLGVRLSWMARIAGELEQAAPWAAGAAALLIAYERFVAGRALPPGALTHVRQLLGPRAMVAGSLPELARHLPGRARWALEGVTDPGEFWRAPAGWWSRVERDGFSLLRRTRPGPDPVVGAVAVLAADAWRVRAALEIAARGGRPLEVFDALG